MKMTGKTVVGLGTWNSGFYRLSDNLICLP